MWPSVFFLEIRTIFCNGFALSFFDLEFVYKLSRLVTRMAGKSLFFALPPSKNVEPVWGAADVAESVKFTSP